MNRGRDITREMMRRAALGYFFDPQPEQNPSDEGQWVPVNVYETDEHVVVVAPMPGVEASNIDVQVHGRRVTLRASLRGKDQNRRRYHIHEWTYGPYQRTLELPVEVDAQHANASHDNGVLVLSLPKAAHTRAVNVPLRQAGSSRAVHEGHSGRDGEGGQ